MKNQLHTSIFITYSLLLFIQSAHSAEIVSRPIRTITNLINPSPNKFFNTIPLDVKKEILKKILNLYGVPIETITISRENMTWCFLVINEYKPVNLFNKTIFPLEFIQLDEKSREIIRKPLNPSFMDKLNGSTGKVISHDYYEDLCTLPRHTTEGLKVKMQPHDFKTEIQCITTTCACGLCCLCLGSSGWARVCCAIGSFCCFYEAIILCCTHCTKKCGIKKGLSCQPWRKNL